MGPLSLAEAAGSLSPLEPNPQLQWRAEPPHRHRRKDSSLTALKTPRMIFQLQNFLCIPFSCWLSLASKHCSKFFTQLFPANHRLSASASAAAPLAERSVVLLSKLYRFWSKRRTGGPFIWKCEVGSVGFNRQHFRLWCRNFQVQVPRSWGGCQHHKTGEGGDGDEEPDHVLCHVHHPEYLYTYMCFDVILTWSWPNVDSILTWIWPKFDLKLTWNWPDFDLILTWFWREFDLKLTINLPDFDPILIWFG